MTIEPRHLMEHGLIRRETHRTKGTLIVAFGPVHAVALAKSHALRGSACVLVTTAKDLLLRTRHSFDLVFCETARRLPQYDEIIRVAEKRGWDVPTPLHEWGRHAATLSGAFKLLEEVHGVGTYSIYSKGGQMGVYLAGQLVMHQCEDGMSRFAKKGEALSCQN